MKTRTEYIAIVMSYDGSQFRGNVQQEHPGTVEHLIRSAAKRINVTLEGPMMWSSRTDKGVSARENIAQIKAIIPLNQDTLKALRAALCTSIYVKTILLWTNFAYKPWTLQTQNNVYEAPRHLRYYAESRSYYYIFNTDSNYYKPKWKETLNLTDISEIAKHFITKSTFSQFTTKANALKTYRGGSLPPNKIEKHKNISRSKSLVSFKKWNKSFNSFMRVTEPQKRPAESHIRADGEKRLICQNGESDNIKKEGIELNKLKVQENKVKRIFREFNLGNVVKREITKFSLHKLGDKIAAFHIVGTGFLYHQIRYMVGAIFQVYMNKIPLIKLRGCISGFDMIEKYLAPSEGLVLLGTEYRKHFINENLSTACLPPVEIKTPVNYWNKELIQAAIRLSVLSTVAS